ncbi:MAG: LamG domain-containing protein, partial [Winogradskyella sp.]|nr:LamG domain-containing protein [Winogradskyella sp.]
MKTKLLLASLLCLFAFSIGSSQSSNVKVKVKWKEKSYNYKVEIYNPANDLIATICDPNHCFVENPLDSNHRYGVKLDLGCVQNANNYYIKIYDWEDKGWEKGAVQVKVAGTEVIFDDGKDASDTGEVIYFNVSGGEAECSSQPDQDQDGIADYLDYDDDGDGIPDGVENLGEDRFECTLPPLDFFGGVYEAASSSGPVDTVGAVYRFGNAIAGYDVLMEIMELTNCAIDDIDDDTVDNPNWLQTSLDLNGIGSPGATFQFTIVDAGTTTPSSEIFRVNGITWDCDGTEEVRESVIYYNPAAYGTENPSDVEITDLGSNNIEMTSGEITVNGHSTLPWLRAYYQFIGNTFTMRMQAHKTTTSNVTRKFAMSFTQCAFLDYDANSLTIVTGEDFDNDGKYNHLDLDSDNDGIPDNVEGQTTLGYIAPSTTVDAKTGIDVVYGTGIEPVNSDFDKYPDILDLDSDNDGLLDIQENGMADAIVSFSDSDDDGLDLLFEGLVVYDPSDPNDDINNPSSSVLPDADGDQFTGGDLDYRDLFNTNPPNKATIDFDGVDDYLATESLIDGLSDITLMAWVKYDATGTTMTIAGEDRACRIELYNGNKPRATFRTQGFVQINVTAPSTIPANEWHHIATTYTNSTGDINLFVDGELVRTASSSATATPLTVTSESNGNFEVGRRSSNITNQEYFKGDIDEVRLFDKVLTESQIQKIVYQEIGNNGGNIQGAIIDKDIEDDGSGLKVAWSNLIGYYPMTDIKNNTTSDYSANDNKLELHNITNIQPQTAPMPYETTTDGDWSSESTWLYGDVWDIENVASNKAWSIVKIANNVTTSASHENLGLIIEPGAKLTVNGDQLIKNNWYLDLGGVLDLKDDAQLIQTSKSDLVTSATGRVLRRQEGNSSYFWYNYWSSPVGTTAATTLSDNNGPANNTNNTDYRLDLIKDESETLFQFTNSLHEVGKISTYWLYSYKNGLTYYDWAYVAPSTALEPGVGYTQKGTGTTNPEQQYIFEGKPNNGTILVNVTDVGGPGSTPSVSKTDYLLGNPYPSALDIHKFIDDNVGVIDGTLNLWQQWSGSSHNLSQYNGGYAQVNKLGSVRAYQFVGLEGAHNGSQDGITTPSRYLPVGQGFMAEIIADGTVEFNNDQRIFIKEADADGTYNNGSAFFRSAAT